MKFDVELYVSLLEAEVKRLRAAQPKRQGAVASMLGLNQDDIDAQRTEFHAPRNMTSEGDKDA